MDDEELGRRLRGRLAAREPVQKVGETAETRVLLPASEQNLGRLMERVEMLEARLDLTYKVVWRTSAALMGLAGASVGWDWVAKIIKAITKQ